MNHVTAAQALSERGVELAAEGESYGDHTLSAAQLLEHAELELAAAMQDGVTVLGRREQDPVDEVLQHFDERRAAYAELVDQLEVAGRRRDEVTVRRERREVARVLGSARATREVGGAA